MEYSRAVLSVKILACYLKNMTGKKQTKQLKTLKTCRARWIPNKFMRRDASLKWNTLRKQSNTIWVVMQRNRFLVVSENAVFIMCGV